MEEKTVSLEEIPSLLRFGKIKSKKSKNLCILHKHGSLAAKDVITLVKKQKKKHSQGIIQELNLDSIQ